MEHQYPYFFGGSIWRVNITVTAMSLLTCIIVAVFAVLATRNLDMRKPRGLQNMIEWVYDFVSKQAGQMMESADVARFLPLGLTLITYLFVANWLGLMGNVIVDYKTGVPALWITGGSQVSFFMSPTANIFAALGLSGMVILLTHYLGLKQPGHYFGHLVHPHWAMLPLNLIEEFAKWLTLGMRLFGNIFAGEVLIYAAMKIPSLFHIPIDVIPLFVWLAYSGFVSTIQAFIFTLLTFAYINQKLFREAH